MTWNPDAKRFSYSPAEHSALLGNHPVEVHLIVQTALRYKSHYEALWKDRPHPWFATLRYEPGSIVHYAGKDIFFREDPETLRSAGYLSGVDVHNLHLHLFHTLCYATKSQQGTVVRRFNKLSAVVPSVRGSMRDQNVYLYFQTEADLEVGRSHFKKAVVLPPLLQPE